jgi:O-glycosyl hydrolase
MLDRTRALLRIISPMRWTSLFAPLLFAACAFCQQAVQLPEPAHSSGTALDQFSFAADGPAGAGWSHPDEIARKYFHENLPALFERTLVVNEDVPDHASLRWIFTGPHAGFTVELSSSKVRIAERYYDSFGYYEGQGSYPEKKVFESEKQFIGQARSLTVIADGHLSVRVLVNGREMLSAPMVFDVTRHQLMFAAPRTVHSVIEGRLMLPEAKAVSIMLKPADLHQTVLGFGGSPSIPAYLELSDAGKRAYWRMLKRYNLLLFREYPMGSELKPDLSNVDNAADATPHYYGDNFPNSEVSNFDYAKHVIDMGGDVIYEMWALPKWATETYNGPRVVDTWNKPVKQAAKPDEYARIVVGYCKKLKAATGAAPLIVGVQNEVDQPPAVFRAMTITLRRELDEAGFTTTQIHEADASYLARGIERTRDLRQDAAAWKAIDFTAAHEYDFQEFIANPDMYNARLQEMREASGDKDFLATEICINDPHYQEHSYRIALAVAELYHKNMTELDAVGLMYCWMLLDVEQPSFAGSRSLLTPDRTRGWIPVASSFQLRVMGAYSRHILKGMKRVGAISNDSDLLASAYTDGKNTTLVMINRSTDARAVNIQGSTQPWAEIERTGLEEENAVSSVPEKLVVDPGEIVVLSTVKAE